jgi:hypothetical protein
MDCDSEQQQQQQLMLLLRRRLIRGIGATDMGRKVVGVVVVVVVVVVIVIWLRALPCFVVRAFCLMISLRQLRRRFFATT